MSSELRNRVSATLGFVLPGGVLFFLTLLFMDVLISSEWLSSLASVFTYLIWGLAAFLAWRFHEFRALVILAVIAASWKGLYIQADPESPLYLLLLLLIPLNSFVILFFPKRGVLQLKNIVTVFFLFLQIPVVILALRLADEWIIHLFRETSLSLFVHLFSGLTFWIIPVTTASIRFVFRRDPVDSGLAWSFVSIWYGLYLFPDMPSVRLFWLSAGLILIISLLEKSYRLAYRDELTDLPSRRALAEHMKTLKGRYSLAMVDIDHFKSVNDRFGHQVGDQVLKKIASLLRGVSGGGRPFRYGGEEFAITFPGKAQKEASDHLEQLRETIRSSPFVLRRRHRVNKIHPNLKLRKASLKTLKITVSIGVAEPQNGSETPEQVIKKADKALYRAKKSGRNCLKG